MFVITDNARLARGIDENPIVIPSNGPLTSLIAVLPLQVCDIILILYHIILWYITLLNCSSYNHNIKYLTVQYYDMYCCYI